MSHIDKAKADTVLVLGASGGIGGEAARQLAAAGWQVRALKRGALPAARDGITWVPGDAMNRGDVMRAAVGASVIVHAVNPPGYRHWEQWVMPMVDNTIAAAAEQHATIVLPGTIYNYGPDAFPLLREDSPQHPQTRKGAIRARLESALSAATGAGARVIVVRAGDFFGPAARNNWLGQGMIQPGRPVSTIRVPGTPGAGHAWAYLPDVGRAMVALLERRRTLPDFATFHMAGHWDPDGQQMAASIAQVVARHGGHARITAFPWWMMPLAAPFVPTMRELLEMRYLWQRSVQLDNSRLKSVLGAEPHTPLDEALETTLAGLGCLPANDMHAAAA